MKVKTASDPELLQQFANSRSEAAFAELVHRHVDLVYSAAARLVGGDTHLAQDVAQSVFTDLAKKAESLSLRGSLTGWLYTSTHFAAAKTVRSERRRRAREEAFMREPNNDSTSEPNWEEIRPVLDDVMHELQEADREAILLRHFENRPFLEVGARLGLSENAARMRVERALERLRSLLAQRGIATSAALSSVISAHAVQLAPATLAPAIVAASAAAAKTGGILTLVKIMTATKLKVGFGVLAAAGATTALVVQHYAQARLLAENDSLRQQLASLKAENEAQSQTVAPAVNPNTLPQDQFSELLRLRGEVGLLRRKTNELAAALASSKKPGIQASVASQDTSALADDYPKTPDGATRGIFEAWGKGDWETFFTRFGEPGVPREVYDRMFTDQVKTNYLSGMEVLSVGEPTNSFGPNMWFVPYKVRFRDGTEKEFRLHVAQDSKTQRWYFKGGF
jgi:RNA polymerase sigma factor (sigma-70 family)